MEAVDIKGRTRAIGAPKNWDQQLDGTCGVLCVRDEVDVQSGHSTMVSAWRPHPLEVKALARGCPVLLTIFGVSHPVVSVSVAADPDEAIAKEGDDSPVLVLPDALEGDLAEILGRPNFMCIEAANLYRFGGAEIAHKAEAEQAYVIHRWMKALLTHGPAWRERVISELNDLKARKDADGES